MCDTVLRITVNSSLFIKHGLVSRRQASNVMLRRVVRGKEDADELDSNLTLCDSDADSETNTRFLSCKYHA